MSSSAHPGRDTFTFAACLPNIDHACAQVERFLTAHQVHEGHFEILLVLRELLNNAVMHGCRQDSGKQVRVTMELADAVLKVQVADQGAGFDWRQRQYWSQPDLNACSGRGLSIIEHYSDSYAFNTEGNMVTFTKKIQRPSVSMASEKR